VLMSTAPSRAGPGLAACGRRRRLEGRMNLEVEASLIKKAWPARNVSQAARALGLEERALSALGAVKLWPLLTGGSTHARGMATPDKFPLGGRSSPARILLPATLKRMPSPSPADVPHHANLPRLGGGPGDARGRYRRRCNGAEARSSCARGVCGTVGPRGGPLRRLPACCRPPGSDFASGPHRRRQSLGATLEVNALAGRYHQRLGGRRRPAHSVMED
jgi:hypothetical protein